MTPNPATMPGDLPVEQAITFFADGARHRSYPVVDADGRLLGLVSRSDALRWQVDGAPAAATLAELLSDAAQPFALLDAPIGEVADMMIKSGVGRIPIVAADTRRVVGILSRQDMLKGRRGHIHTEQLRSR